MLMCMLIFSRKKAVNHSTANFLSSSVYFLFSPTFSSEVGLREKYASMERDKEKSRDIWTVRTI